jgi:hypothetical protein
MVYIPTQRDDAYHRAVAYPGEAKAFLPIKGYELALLQQDPVRPCRQVYWKERFPVDHARLKSSREALHSLFLDHTLKRNGKVYPWRLALSPATGLPAFLRTWLDHPLAEDDAEDDEAALGAAGELLATGLRAQAIFGKPIDFGKEFEKGSVIKLSTPEQGEGAQPIHHFTWRQVYNGLPVIGGSVRVHEGVRDERVSITSSYFPVSDSPPSLSHLILIHPEIALLRALQATIQVAPARVKGALLLTLIREFLARWDTGGFVTLMAVLLPMVESKLARWPMAGVVWLARLSPAMRQLLERLLGLMRRLLQQVPILKWLVKYLLGATQPAADVTPVPIRGSYFAILPFDAEYHLISRVRIGPPQEDAWDAWYADVDMHTGEVLGEPWQALIHALNYYKDSEEALGNSPSGDAETDLNIATLQVYIKEITDGTKVVEFDDLVTGASSIEATNVAIHAQRLFDHLQNGCGVTPESLRRYTYQDADGSPKEQRPGLEARVNSDHPTCFIYGDDRHPKTIRFQRDPGDGIPEGDKEVFHPAHDPEVILHEFTHGLLWLLNPEPWDIPPTLTPFGRALHEGYAMYLSRSIAAQDLNEADEIWARAAYRSEDWGDRWKFGRELKEVGADLLPAPNTYPAGEYSAQTLQVYDAGMIWARALWDLRETLRWEIADFLAVQAFPYLHGYIANFELAAEGLLEADLQVANSINLTNGTQPIWAGRGIAAGQGIHGFAEHNSALFAATDTGILRYDTVSDAWVQDSQLADGSGVLTGVVAIASDSSNLYAAAQLPPSHAVGSGTQWEPGIFKKGATGWERAGNWAENTSDATPMHLLIVNGSPLVGTSRGVYYRSNGNWETVVSGNPFSINNAFLTVGLVAQRLNAAALLHACTPTSLRRTITSPQLADWTVPAYSTDVFGGTSARTTAMILWKDKIYVGTLDEGLWRISDPPGFYTTRVYNTTDAILALAATDDKLYFATSNGVFESTSDDGTAFTPVSNGLPASVTVVSLHATDGDVLAGTLSSGIWRHTSSGWEQVHPPETLASIEMAADEKALLSFVQSVENQHSPIEVLPSAVNLLKVVQPGFPLKTIEPNADGTYSLTQGPVILLLENGGADLMLSVTVSSSGGVTLSTT